MKRAERLAELVVILRGGAVHKGYELAARFNVSLRTIYRDMETLTKSGLPVLGEPGTGYRARSVHSLPPLNLTKLELEALHIGVAAVARVKDKELSNAAQNLSQKLDTALDENGQSEAGWQFATYPFADMLDGIAHIAPLRAAIRARQKCRITQTKNAQMRIIRPLALDYWGRVWTICFWCDTNNEFATLRLEQITALLPLSSLFVDEAGKTLADMPRR